MGLDLNKMQTRLLGDAFYETRLVRDQLMALTGTRYLFAGVTDDAKTMRLLMDNAAEEGRRLGLSVGVALSPEQLANLTKDVVWLEEQTYMGETVLVPRLYLAATTRANLAEQGTLLGGTTLAGSNVSIGAGSIRNSGVIKGGDVRLDSASDIINRDGNIFAKNTLVAKADGSIISHGGNLGAETVGLLAGQDIRLGTSTATGTGTSGGHTRVTHTGTTVAGNTVIMQAGQDIAITGGSVNAADTAVLAAGRDVLLTAAQNSDQGSIYRTNGLSRRVVGTESTTTHTGATLSGGSVNVQAGRDIALAGSSLTAANDASLVAGRDISLLSVVDSGSRRGPGSKKVVFGWMGTKVTEEELTHQGSSISTGGNLSMMAGADATQGQGSILLRGSSASAGGNALLSATGNIIVASETDFSSKKEGFGNWSRYSEQTTFNRSGISAGGNLDVHADKDVVLVGASLRGQGTITVSAGQDVLLGSLESSTYSKTKQAGDKTIRSTVTQHGSSIDGADVAVGAGRDVVLAGSSIAASNDASVTAGHNITMLAVQDEEHTYKKRTSSGGMFGSSSTSVKQTDVFTNVGSSISAGNDLRMAAGADASQGKGGILLEASSASAGGKAALSATGDITLTAAMDSRYSYKSESRAGMFSASSEMKASQYNSAVGSSILGHDVDIHAGDNVLITGSRVVADNNLALTADMGDVIVAAAQDTYWSRKQRQSSSWNIGGILLAPMTMPTLVIDTEFYSAKAEKGKTVGTANIGSILAAGNDMSIQAGRDVSLIGSAAVADNDLSILAGRDVNIIPGRDVNIIPGREGYGFGFGQGKSSSDWVGQQTSIIGRNAVDIYTEKNTHLKGAVIAADNGALLLNTGTFSFENIKDKDKGREYQIGMGGSYDSRYADQSALDNPLGKNRLPVIDVEYSSYIREQQNRATIGDGLIIVRDGTLGSLGGLNRDLSYAREMTKDKKVGVNIYVSPSTMEDLFSNGLDGDLGRAWTFPNTSVGIFAGLLGAGINEVTGRDQEIYSEYNALNFTNSPFTQIARDLGISMPSGAMTLGNVVIYSDGNVPNAITDRYDGTGTTHFGTHEEAHTYQYQFYGPTYIFNYFINGGFIGKNNQLEQDADNYSQENRLRWKIR